MKLIDADTLKSHAVECNNKHEFGEPVVCVSDIDNAPTIGAASMIHGDWRKDKGTIKCSNCGFGMFETGYFFKNGECFSANDGKFTPLYCPNCGAKMGDSE